MAAQADHERGLAHAATNNPKYDTPEEKVAEAVRLQEATRKNPEAARNELFGKPQQDQRDIQIDNFVGSLGDEFDASRVEPQIQRMQDQLTTPFAAAGDDVLGPVKAAIKAKVWEEIERRKLNPRKAGNKGANTLPGADMFDKATGAIDAMIPSRMPSWYPIGSAL